MKIICIGFPRTGTYSLVNAVKHLGYTVYEHIDMYENFLPEFHEILRGRETGVMVDKVCNAADVLTGQFVSNAWYKLYLRNPDVKVIFRERQDLNAWSKGVSAFLRGILNRRSPVPSWLSPSARFRDELERLQLEGLNPEFFTTRDLPKSYLRAHKLHKAQVQALIPPEQLLVFRPGDGWAPLCRFLNIANIPEIPYPHVNASSKTGQTDFATRYENTILAKKIRKETRWAILFMLSFVFGILALCVMWINF